MNEHLQDIARVALIGVGATGVMDLWLWALKRMKVPTMNFALLGRWFGHLLRGRWRHDAIARSAPIERELALGWTVHYATGVGFAALLVSLVGAAWTDDPTVGPALAVGIATVLFPLFVMQPAMGAGIASSKTAAPVLGCLRSLVNHTVFGLGLYVAAVVLSQVAA